MCKISRHFGEKDIKDIAIHIQGLTNTNFNVSFHERFSILFGCGCGGVFA